MPEPDTSPAEPVPDQTPEPAPAETAAVTRWVYSGPVERVYTGIPVTVQPGDVIEHAGPPAADGYWGRTKKAVTRRPDNTPEE